MTQKKATPEKSDKDNTRKPSEAGAPGEDGQTVRAEQPSSPGTGQPAPPAKADKAAKSGKTTKPAKRGAKAKKADVKRGISHDLIPIAEETWLLQPIAVTMMRHDYSQVQVRILVSIVESLQNILQGLLSGSPSRQLSIFHTDELDEDGRMPIKMTFKELGVNPSHYPQLRTSLKMLASIPVEIPYKTKEGRKYTKATNLCDVYLPEDNCYSKYAILKIDRSVAERLVSFDFGYHRLGKQIVFACKNRYTQRIYMFIASWLEKGKAVIDPLEFRKMLRLEHNYKKFPDFCRRVLDPAQSELKKLAEDGFCDCWFDYQRVYTNGQRGGEPDKLVFTIHRSGSQLTAQLAELTATQRRHVAELLVRHFLVKPEEADKLAARVTPELYQEAVQKLLELTTRFKTAPVRDRAAYTYRAMDQFLREREVATAEAEELPATGKKAPAKRAGQGG